jgi:hypothetical protein
MFIVLAIGATVVASTITLFVSGALIGLARIGLHARGPAPESQL